MRLASWWICLHIICSLTPKKKGGYLDTNIRIKNECSKLLLLC